MGNGRVQKKKETWTVEKHASEETQLWSPKTPGGAQLGFHVSSDPGGAAKPL